MSLISIFAAFVLPFGFSPSWAQGEKPLCSSKEIREKGCEFLRANKDKKEIRTSDGGSFPNPFFVDSEPPVNANQNMAYGYTSAGGEFDYNAIFDTQIEIQMDIVDIITSSSETPFPPKTLKSLENVINLGALLARVYPEDTNYAQLRHQPVYGVTPPASRNGKVKVYTPEMIQSFVKELGPKALKELKARYDQYIKESVDQMREQISRYEGVNSVYSVEPAKKNSSPLRSQERQLRLFNYAKSKMRDMILKGRGEDKITAEEKSLLQRIETIELSFNEDLLKASCLEELPNAAYLPVSHQIILCPGILDYPDAMLIATLGHEINHSIDSCNMRHDLYKIDKNKLRQFLESKIDTSSPMQQKSYLRLSEVIKADVKFITRADLLFNEEDLKSLKADGTLLISNARLAKDQHPLHSLRACLVEE